MSGGEVLGSAFIEVHARASADLQREIKAAVDDATAKAANAARTMPSGYVVRQGSGNAPTVPDAMRFPQPADQTAAPLTQATAAEITELKRQAKEAETLIEEAFNAGAATVEDYGDAVKTAGSKSKGAVGELRGLSAAGLASTSSLRSLTSGLLTGAAAAGPYAVAIGLAVAAVTKGIAAFTEAGKARSLNPEDQANYERLTSQVALLRGELTELAVNVGSIVAPTLQRVAGTLNLVTGAINSTVNKLKSLGSGFRDAEKVGDDLDTVIQGLTDSVTLLNLAQEQAAFDTKRTADLEGAAGQALDSRIDATVRAIQADLEREGAMVAVADAQQRVRDVEDEIAASHERSADAAEKVARGYRAIREAQQGLADAGQDVIDKERRLAEARRDLQVTSFEQGSGSQAALDAADKVQSAEFDLVRAREEQGDAADDIRQREADLAKAREEAAEATKNEARVRADAQRDLDDALRTAAKVEADLRIALWESAGGEVTATDALRIRAEEMAKFASQGGPAYRGEIDLINAALDRLPAKQQLITDKLLAGLSDAAKSVPALRDLATMDFATGAPLASGVTGSTGSPTIVINNTFNVPVDPAQVANEQAAQVGKNFAPASLQ